jgi:hypothetical protein
MGFQVAYTVFSNDAVVMRYRWGLRIVDSPGDANELHLMEKIECERYIFFQLDVQVRWNRCLNRYIHEASSYLWVFG